MSGYFYSTDRINFQYIRTGGAYTNVAFSDDLHGIISPANGVDKIFITRDGGTSWDPIDLNGEFYQPVGIKGTTTFYALREASISNNRGQLIRSDNGGISWRTIYQYWDSRTTSVTGTVQYGSDLRLFFQTCLDNSEGIMMSEDTGKSFFSICGPKNEVDTKFFVRDSFIYAGGKDGGLWLNTTGIGSNSAPILSHPSIAMQTADCINIDTMITFTFFDSCNGRHAQLLEASVSGSPSFSLSGASPRIIHANDSLGIHYQWSTSPNDTGKINLRFKLGWKEFDTTVTLFGKAIQKENIVLQSSLTRFSAKAGDGTELLIKPDKAAVNKNLSEIDFTLTYNSDVLDGISPSTDIPGAAIILDPISTSGRYTIQPITITGANMSLDPAKAIARLSFKAMLSDSISSPLRVSDVRLNKGDADYERCTLSATSDSAAFNLEFLCGDKILVDHLRGNKLNFSIISLRPNPASNVLEVEVNSLADQNAEVEIIDATGHVVLSKAEKLSVGRKVLKVDISDISSGSYVLRLRSGDDVVTEKFVKQQ